MPKQGTWWNPQEQANSPDTWCAYIIRSSKPNTIPFYNEGNDNGSAVNGVAVQKISTIDLQFVGPQAEDIAQSVAFWSLRSDVQEEFRKIRGSLLYSDGESRSSNFYQDGVNNVVAWNVTIRVLWYDVIDTTQGRMPGMVLNGKVKK